MNFLGLEGEAARYESASVAVIPAPYEATCSYRPGAARGPKAVLEASPNAEWYDEEQDMDLDRIGIATLPPLPLADLEPEEMVEVVAEAARRVLSDGKIPAGLGGEHTVSLGFVEAALAVHPGLTVLQIDAHPDLRDSYEGRKICHATVGRRIHEIAPLVQVGVRAWSREEDDYMKFFPKREGTHGASNPLHVFRAAWVHRDENWIDAVLDALGDEVYVTFDVDGLDPSLMPATGTPEPGGLLWRQAADLLAGAAARSRIVGFDVVELSPVAGLHHPDFTAARLAARLVALACGKPSGKSR